MTLKRKIYTPGERLFIDYAGQTIGVTDDSSSGIRTAQVFEYSRHCRYPFS